MESTSWRRSSVNPRDTPDMASRNRAGKSIEGTTGVSVSSSRSMHSASMPSPWSTMSMPRSRAMSSASLLAMWPRTLAPRWWAASMAAPSSSRVTSVCSRGPTVPWPPVTKTLIISAPSLISRRTERRNSSAPSLRRMDPRAPTSQWEGKLRSPACPVELTSRLHGTRRGPVMRRRSTACFIDASMANGAPALTAEVKPARTSLSRLVTARTACMAIGSSSPNGAVTAPRLWYVAWKWQLTMPGMTVRPPRSTTRSSGRGPPGTPPATEVMRSPSTTTVARSSTVPSPTTTWAPSRTSRAAGAATVNRRRPDGVRGRRGRARRPR